MKRWIPGVIVGLIALLVVVVPYALLSQRTHELACCEKPVDVLGNAQALHSATDTPAMCRQAGGNIIWVDNLFVGCVHGNAVGSTVAQ